MLKFETTTDLDADRLASFDLIIDVRSPSEYAEDHIPGAVNLPVLDDDERARVGTIYKQVSPFEARRLGAALVARNIAHHIDTTLSDQPQRFHPLVYCWRGGMRSNSMAIILASIGWRAALVHGGYKTWRRQVVDALDRDADDLPLIVIDGQTGSAKTEILKILANQGEQVIDLEGVAAHRGSVFGPLTGQEQPGQKSFETTLWDQIRRFDPGRPIYIEAESALVGKCRVPKRIWQSMKVSPRIRIAVDPAERARYLTTAYPDLIENRSKINRALDQLTPHHGHDKIEVWRDLAGRGEWRSLAERLIVEHYDPAYDRSRKRADQTHDLVLDTRRLDPGALADLANRIVEAARQLRRAHEPN